MGEELPVDAKIKRLVIDNKANVSLSIQKFSGS
jgi:hypothetical protein